MHPIESETLSNYMAFQTMLPSLLVTHWGQFALMRNEKIVAFFDTAREAFLAGQKRYPEDEVFSVEEVTDNPIIRGFYTYFPLEE